MDVLVCDDDKSVGNMLVDTLRAVGLEALYVEGGLQLLDGVKQHHPKVVILDIMMPGVDGLTLCKAIKEGTEGKKVHVIVLSGKKYGQVAQDAARCGAEAFLPKPFDFDTLFAVMRRFLPIDPGTSRPKRAAAGLLRIWGHRGAEHGIKEGVETSCLSLDVRGRRIILDAGTGVRRMCAGPALDDPRVALFLTHYHNDHVEGLRFLKYAADPAVKLTVWGPPDPRSTVEKLIADKLPRGGNEGADVSYHHVSEADWTLWPGMTVSAIYTMHPVTTVAYRLEFSGRRFVYCPDNELSAGGAFAQADYEKKLRAFIEGADLMIHDARFLEADIEDESGRGHSSPGRAAGLALDAGVKRLVFFHADARYSEEALAAELDGIRRRLGESETGLAVNWPVLETAIEI